MLRRRLLAAAGLLVVAAACGGDSDAGPPVPEMSRMEELPVELTIRIDGDLRGAIEGQVVTSTFMAVSSADPGKANSLIFGVEPMEPVVAGDVALSAGFAVIPFRGDGSYTIPAGSPSDKPKEGDEPERSSIRVIFSPSGANYQTDAKVYFRREEPCRVEVADNGTTGTLRCPRVTGEQKDSPHFSLEMSWKVPPAGTGGGGPVPPTGGG